MGVAETTRAEMVVEILEPFLGRVAADTCVRASALALGTTSDSLGAEHMPAVIDRIVRVLSPIAPRTTIDAVVGDIKARTR